MSLVRSRILVVVVATA